MSTCCKLNKIYQRKKTLKKKNFKLMRKLKIITKCLARFIKVFKNIKHNNAIFILKNKFLKKYKNWKRKIDIQKRDIVTNVTELILTESIMFNLLAKWRFTVFIN